MEIGSPQGPDEVQCMGGANIPDASEECDHRGASEFPRLLLKHIPGAQSIGRVASSDRFKKTERSHFRTSLSYVHYELSSEYHQKRRLRIQDRSEGIPIRPFQVDFMIFYGQLHAVLGCPYGGFPDVGYQDPFRPQAPYQFFGTQSINFGPTSLGFSVSGPPGFDCYGQHNSSFLYQQTRRVPFPFLVSSSSGSLYVATSSGHSSQSQAHPRLFERDSPNLRGLEL